MSALEFIRKNSLLVLIVVAAVGLGLLMMDYSDKGSMFSRDYYIQVNGTNYTYPEVAGMGENGESYLASLHSGTAGKLRTMFDKNEDDNLSEDELATLSAFVAEHPEYDTFPEFIAAVLQSWSYGFAEDASVNIAINRAVLQQEAAALGITPSKEQIDAYIQAMPAFRRADGGFDQEFYHRMTGFYKGVANNAQEKSFRSVISDLIVWESLTNMLTEGMRFNTKATSDLIDALSQQVKGKTAWLPASAAAAPAEPTEEELKAYWEQNKDNYKSTERRIVSVYELTPGEGSNLDALMVTADTLMQDLSQANGKGFDNLLQNAADNPENEPFSYKKEDGKSHTTYALCTREEAPEALKMEVDHNGNPTALADIAFNEIEAAPAVAEYEAAVAAGTADQLPAITQVRGYFPTRNGKLIFIRVEAIETPQTLEYEPAKAKALADLKKERADKALEIAANKLYEEMQAELANGTDAAFAKASAAGATVEDFGPVGIGLAADASKLPAGLETQALLSVAKGKLAPIVIREDGARISVVTDRTFEDSPEYSSIKAFSLIPSQNAQLRVQLVMDWLHNAYARYEVRLSEHIKLNQ